MTEARAYVTVASHDGTDLAALAAELKAAWPCLQHTIVLEAAGGGAVLDRLLDSVRSPDFLSVFSVGGTVVLAPDGSPDTVFPLIA
ncbi:hypothetical protein [Parafrankia elaeagni]|uniref:hypothetical protein n=1 Tax=Parafrankia elaeagni TaxID=222534 RepID=UPI0003653AA9|nr:hypothetical protein [Parafrankia elaeagni]